MLRIIKNQTQEGQVYFKWICSVYNDISKVNDKSEVLSELRTRRDSKS